MTESEILELERGISSLNLTKEDQAYKSFRQYFMIRLYDLLHPVKAPHIKLFFTALRTWNGLISALQNQRGNPEVTRKNALCRTANGLYSFPFLSFKDILPTIQTIKMFKTSEGGPVISYNDFEIQRKQPGGVNAIVVSKCSMYAFNYDDVRTNVKNFIEYIVKNSHMTRVYEKIFLHDAEKIDHFLLQLYSMVDGGITSIESFMSTIHQVTILLIVDGIQQLGTKNDIIFLIDFSSMYLNPGGLQFNPGNVKIGGNIQGLIDDLSLIDEFTERQAQKDIQERRQLNMDERRVHEELARIRALQPQEPPQQELSDEERQRFAESLVAHDKATATTRSTKVEHDTQLAHENGIDYPVFQMLFKCSFSELLTDADTISKCSDIDTLQYLSTSNLSKYMRFTELNAKYLLIVGYLKNKLRNSFLICGRTALQMNCVLLSDEIERAADQHFFTAFQKSCTDFDCQFVIPPGIKPKQTFLSVYNLFLKKGHDIFMAYDAWEIPQSVFFRLKMQKQQILEIRSEHSDKTIKVKESDGRLFHSVCDITFVPTSSVTPLIELFLTNPASLTLSGRILGLPDQPQPKLTELDISFQFPSPPSLLFECVGIVDSILNDFKSPQTEEKERLQFFYLLKFASRACQCAYLISLQSRMTVNISVILRAESSKFDNDLILGILNLFLKRESSGGLEIVTLNELAYIAFQSYKEKGTITKIIMDVYKLLQQGLSQQAGKKLTFSLGGGKMVKNINKKLKNTKKYKRVNKKYHSKYKNNNMTNKKCHTRRKNRRQSFRVKI